MHHLLTLLVAPGFFGSAQVRTAVIIGGAVAVVSAVVGVFTVVRGQSFGGHVLTDVATAGGSGALLAGVSQVAGFVGISVLGGAAMEAIGVQRVRGRDLATGVVLGVATGLSALFLSLDATAGSTTGAAQQVLFGSVFTITPGTIPVVVTASVIALAVMAAIGRPLLLASVSPDLAAARGVPVRLTGLAYMLALAVAVGLSSLATGSILSTALLIGPAAAATRLTRSIAAALAAACLTGVASAWAGVLLAYDSATWGGASNGLPVSFFIVALCFAAYLASGLPGALARTRRRAGVPAAAEAQ